MHATFILNFKKFKEKFTKFRSKINNFELLEIFFIPTSFKNQEIFSKVPFSSLTF